MTASTPYLFFPGTARKALAFYAGVFGGRTEAATFADGHRSDGPPSSIAHGALSGPVSLFVADVADGEPVPTHGDGIVLALLGTAAPEVMRGWFDALTAGGRVIDALQARPWGDHDGRVVDRFGVPWLLGFQPAEEG